MHKNEIFRPVLIIWVSIIWGFKDECECLHPLKTENLIAFDESRAHGTDDGGIMEAQRLKESLFRE